MKIAMNFDNEYRKMAVEKLCELRGRLLEVKELISRDAPTDIVQDRIDYIVNFPLYGNPYLSEFQFTIKGSYGTKKTCDDLISQIDDQIYKIWFSD